MFTERSRDAMSAENCKHLWMCVKAIAGQRWDIF